MKIIKLLTNKYASMHTCKYMSAQTNKQTRILPHPTNHVGVSKALKYLFRFSHGNFYYFKIYMNR